MDSSERKIKQNPSLRTHKRLFAAQICLRVLAIAATLAATWLMLTCKQTVVVFGLVVDARYSYSPAFKFFAFANLIACALSLLSLFLAFILGRKDSYPRHYFYMFLHDLVVMTLLMAGCSAATAIGYVGMHGNSHAGWIAICDHFAKFCDRVTISVGISYLSFLFFLCLTIMSASRSRKIQV